MKKMDNILVWDIETIPQIAGFSDIQLDKMKNKIEYQMNNNDMTEDEAKNLIGGTNPFFGQVICISLLEVSPRFPQINKCSLVAQHEILPDGTIIPEEKALLDNFWEYIRTFTGTYVGFNSLKFDAYFIEIRSMYNRIKPTNMNFLDFRLYQTHPHYDIMQQLSNWQWPQRPGLEQICEFFGIPTPKDGAVSAATVSQAYKDNKLKEIAEYAAKDVEATYEIYKITKNYVRK